MHACRCLLNSGVKVLEAHNEDQKDEVLVEGLSEQADLETNIIQIYLFEVCKEVGPFINAYAVRNLFMK